MEVTLNKIGYHIEAFDSVDECRNIWPEYDPPHLFLGYDFLQVASDYAPTNISTYFAIISDENGPFGFFAYEVNIINMYKSLEYNLSKPQTGWINKVNNLIRTFIAKRVNINALVSGNSMATGEYAFYLKPEYKDRSAELLSVCNDFMLSYLDQQGVRCVGVYTKDYFEKTYESLKELETKYRYTPFKVQPNMILRLDPSWHKPEDYKQALTSKYRVRNKRARKKAEALNKRELSLNEIEFYQEKINEAYLCIATQVDFNLFILDSKYFCGLKVKFGDHFKLVGYFLGDELVGFYTYFIWHDLIEAHFLGCFEVTNRQYHIYHNILLDLVEVSILHQKSELILSRTALEIKSSIGAEPYEMYGFIKHRKRLIQWITPRIFNNLNPSKVWTPRKPFKEKKS